MTGRPLGVYVHVPWCAARCSYCDFNTYLGDAGRSSYVDAVAASLAWQVPSWLGDPARPVDTVFFGGGTPTLLSSGELVAVLELVRSSLGLADGAEVTVEANPDSVTPASLAALRSAGFTRVSFGMQSAAPHVLAFLGRTHAFDRPAEAVSEARAAGFSHVSLDLIYGSPVETAPDWLASLEAVLGAGVDHVSAYGLTVEPGTRLGADVRRGRVPAPDPDVMAERYVVADELLSAAGFSWYEISNWAACPEARCRHNVGYWRGGDWLALGPGAHGHVAGTRFWTTRLPTDWARRSLAGDGAIDGTETLTEEQRHTERIMLELRTREGLDASLVAESEVTALAEEGLVEIEQDHLVLTLRGRLLADHVIRRLATAPLAAA